MKNVIKISLNGQGGELDSRIAFFGNNEDEDGRAISAAVRDLADNCILAVGDTITIEEIVQ